MQRRIVTNDAFRTLVVIKNNKIGIRLLAGALKFKSYKL